MTVNKLLHDLKAEITDAVKNFALPTSLQKDDKEIEIRPPEVIIQRLPDSRAAKKKAPYILIQFVNSIDKQTHGRNSESSAIVRLIICTYCENETEGAAQLMNVVDSIRLRLLKRVVIGDQFKLDTDAGLETLVYNDDTAPYYAGEMIGTFIIPAIEREVSYDF